MSHPRGTTATLEFEYTDGTGAYATPTNPRVTIFNPTGATVIADAVPTFDSLGHYHYDFAVPLDAPLGTWISRGTGTILGSPVTGDDEFEVAAAASSPLTLPPLASADDLATVLQTSFTGEQLAAAELLLTLASGAIRSEAHGQQITAGTSTVRLRPSGGIVRLPQWPVTDVTAVTDVDEVAVNYEWDGLGPLVSVCGLWPRATTLVRAHSESPVIVTYSHGYAEGEAGLDPARTVCLQLVGRTIATPADQMGVESETIVSYSYRLSKAVVSGVVGLTDDEKRIIHRYRQPARPIRMDRR